jgi:uncharacterized protein YjdB
MSNMVPITELSVDDTGKVTAVSQGTVQIPQESANRDALFTAAANALATNRSFIANASPTNVQVVAQLKAMARQMNAIIRITLNQLDGTD